MKIRVQGQREFSLSPNENWSTKRIHVLSCNSVIELNRLHIISCLDPEANTERITTHRYNNCRYFPSHPNRTNTWLCFYNPNPLQRLDRFARKSSCTKRRTRLLPIRTLRWASLLQENSAVTAATHWRRQWPWSSTARPSRKMARAGSQRWRSQSGQRKIVGIGGWECGDEADIWLRIAPVLDARKNWACAGLDNCFSTIFLNFHPKITFIGKVSGKIYQALLEMI